MTYKTMTMIKEEASLQHSIHKYKANTVKEQNYHEKQSE